MMHNNAKLKNVACTIVSKNYFAYAKTLNDSFLEKNKDCDFYILLVDRKDVEFENAHSNYKIVWVEDLAIKDFYTYAFKYDILELNTNVKPAFLRYLLKSFEKVIYLDPDIFVYNSLINLYSKLDNYSILLTPHVTTPIPLDGHEPKEEGFLKGGVFNLGFVAVKADKNGFEFLDWWNERCLELGYNEVSQGLFVDQKWVDLAPCLFSQVYIEKDISYNMAYWNLHERSLSKGNNQWIVNNNQPLKFFHFSGISVSEPEQISRYQNRFNFNNRSDLREIFSHYIEMLLNNEYSKYCKIPYGFSIFSNGVVVSALARRVYSIEPQYFSTDNPFDAKGPVYNFCLKNKLLNLKKKEQIIEKKSIMLEKNSRYIKFLNFSLKMVQRLFNPTLYNLFLKYLTFISSVRNQKDFYYKKLKK